MVHLVANKRWNFLGERVLLIGAFPEDRIANFGDELVGAFERERVLVHDSIIGGTIVSWLL